MYTAAASTDHAPPDHAASQDSVIYGAVENSRGRYGSDAILIDGNGYGDGEQYAQKMKEKKKKMTADASTPSVLKNLFKLTQQRPIQASMACLAFLLLLVALAYQMMVGSVNVWPDGAKIEDLVQVQREIVHDFTYINSATFSKLQIQISFLGFASAEEETHSPKNTVMSFRIQNPGVDELNRKAEEEIDCVDCPRVIKRKKERIGSLGQIALKSLF